jgi:BirA family biotin operon repressor/biotin-[acetyl-CoA-carboxylase] ligase
MFDLAALEAELAGTIFAGKLHFSAVTDSTNTDAMAAARAGAAHGTVCFADAQLAGRGRGGHAWLSVAGEGLYVSVVLRPTAPSSRWPLLPFCAGLAAMEAIREAAGVVPDLRWPNDVLISSPQKSNPLGSPIDAKKVCGILVEAGTDVKAVGFAVAGIGINVHQREFDGELATPATSLDLEAGRRVSRQKLLVCLIKSLQREAESLAEEAAAKRILARVGEASTWIRGRKVDVHGPQPCSGVTAGLDEHGFLKVETANGLVTVQTGGIRAAEMD